ncbi:hypothetical protein BBH56_06520 [Spiribacter roseus]|nr:hypothetical protein BBH56_06520 [Spiribacter roseus]
MTAAGKWHNTPMMNVSPIRLALGVALATALIAGALTALWPSDAPPERLDPDEAVGTVLPEARDLPAVTLTDHDGGDWTASDFEGRWQYLFFGFTHCPDVCPMTLATLAGALERLEQADVERLPGVVFVSVDPQRDTPAAMETYVEHFSDDFIGVTGQRDAIDRLTSALGISYTLHEPDSEGDYAVDHSAAILLIDPQGRLRALWQPPHGRDVLADEFRRIRGQYPSEGRS